MARISNGGTSPSISYNRNITGETMGSSSRGPRPGTPNAVTTDVVNSPAYKSAYEVLSQESDKSWLQRLEMIPYSVTDAKESFTDQFGFTTNYADKQAANYQYCMEQISALMSEYQSWKNSLPVTQSQQFADAGINAAITGQGISGSSISNVGVATDPSTVQSANVGDFVFKAIDSFLNLQSGKLEWISKFNDIALSGRRLRYDKDSSFAEFAYQLSKDGVILPDDVKSFDDLINHDDKTWLDSAGARAKRLFNEFMEIRSMDSYGHTIIDRTQLGDYRSGNMYMPGSGEVRFGSPFGASIDIAEYSKNISDLQYTLWLKELEYKAKYAEEKKAWHDENGYTNSEDIELFESETKASEKIIKDLERQKMKIYVDYIKKLKSESDSGNLSSRVQLMDALYELTYASQILDFGDELYEIVKDWIN